jgi:peptidoglycan/LPS O-acetylase OafA/YrhL
MGELDSPCIRDHALDFTKGVLVLFMVLYHWMNYFVGIEGPVYPYLRFIPPSFIFISGFLLINVYPKKYGLDSSKLYGRLLVRGLKILTLFTFLNVAVNMLFPNNYRGAITGIEAFISNASAIYIGGNGRMIFSVLLPISYLLIVSTAIFLGMRASKYALNMVCVASFICVSFLDYYAASSQNLSLIAVGILGMVFGQYPLKQIVNWASHLWALSGLYIGYLVAINIWGERYFLEVIGVCLSVLLIYGVGVKISDDHPIGTTLVMLGKYSLFAYIAQIGLLQILQWSLATMDIHYSVLWVLSFIGTITLTITAVWSVHQICSKSYRGYKIYRIVFA